MKTLSIIIVGILLISLAIAQATSVLNISLTKETTDILKETNDIQTISIKATDVECNKVECWSKVYQDGLINQEWRTRDITKCTKNKTTELITTEIEQTFDTKTQTQINKTITFNTGVFETTCTETALKTLVELTAERDAWVQNRISGYASVQADRANLEVEK